MSKANLPESRPLNIQNDADQKYQCDFCNVSFKCDLDASRHLSTGLHMRNKNSFVALQGQNKSLHKQTPRNLTAVFQALKLRSVKDLRELADKDYFEIVDEKTAEIAKEMGKVLYKRHLEFEANKKFPPDIARQFLSKMAMAEKKATKIRNSNR